MASLKEVKGRIASVNNTRKITSAMKMVASAKLHKAQAAIFIAEVIFRVLFTEAILPFTSFSDAMTIRSL